MTTPPVGGCFGAFGLLRGLPNSTMSERRLVDQRPPLRATVNGFSALVTADTIAATEVLSVVYTLPYDPYLT